jgi:hypothetical protein
MNEVLLFGSCYRTIELIAQGLMGPLYRGLDLQLNQFFTKFNATWDLKHAKLALDQERVS